MTDWNSNHRRLSASGHRADSLSPTYPYHALAHARGSVLLVPRFCSTWVNALLL